MSLYMSTFEDLLSMKTRAFLVKDIDPEILRRLLGNRSLATELTEEQLADYYSNKVPKPTDSSELLNLMSKGGGLDRKWANPLYAAKLKGIEHNTIEQWVKELASQGKITKLRSTGVEELDDKWFTTYMAEIHGTLGCISEAGGKMTDILGKEMVYNTESVNHENGILVTNGLIHQDALNAISRLDS